MDPLTALTLLLGIYSGAWYGGAIPAILINTQGTPVNVLTTYDGYPMTLAGPGAPRPVARLQQQLRRRHRQCGRADRDGTAAGRYRVELRFGGICHGGA